jgi:hypothetical protein
MHYVAVRGASSVCRHATLAIVACGLLLARCALPLGVDATCESRILR